MDLNRISKTISFMLRHSTDPLYISLDGGWALTDYIIDAVCRKYPGFDRDMLEEIVEKDEKQRYSFDESGCLIRCNQGHSIPGVIIKMETPVPPEVLYHGTADRFLSSIMKDGLRPMTRNYVHLSKDHETALKVGLRHGRPVVLKFRALDFYNDGHDIFLSPNGIWLAKYVPSEYLSQDTEKQDK